MAIYPCFDAIRPTCYGPQNTRTSFAIQRLSSILESSRLALSNGRSVRDIEAGKSRPGGRLQTGGSTPPCARFHFYVALKTFSVCLSERPVTILH
jgi:hypothetical protein